MVDPDPSWPAPMRADSQSTDNAPKACEILLDRDVTNRRTQRRYEEKYAVVFLRFMVMQVMMLLSACKVAKKPVLSWYCQDATTTTTTERRVVNDKIKFLRTRHDVLVERYYVTDGSEIAVVVADGRLMERKRCIDILAARCEFPAPRLRQVLDWFCCEVYCADRGSNADRTLRKLYLQWHREQYRLYSDDSHAKLLELMELIFYIGCALHDVHNGCKEALIAAFGKDELNNLIDTLFAVTISLQDSKWAVLGVDVGSDEYLRFDGEEEEFESSKTRSYLEALRLDPGTIDKCILYGFKYDKSRELWSVCRVWEDSKDEVRKFVRDLMLDILEFYKATLTRWLSLGKNARQLLICRFFGLGKVVAEAKRTTPHIHDALNSYSKLDSIVHFLEVVSVVTCPFDSVLTSILRDDRIPSVMSTRKQWMDEVEKIPQIAESHTLFSETDVGSEDVQNSKQKLTQRAVAGCAVGGTYLQYVLYDQYDAWPWRLVSNVENWEDKFEEGIRANLQELKDTTIRHGWLDMTSKKIQILMRMNNPEIEQGIVNTLKLLVGVPTSIAQGEQAHGNHTKNAAHHQRWNIGTILRKGVLKFFRETLDNRDREERRIAREEAALEEAERKEYYVRKDRPSLLFVSDEIDKWITENEKLPDYDKRLDLKKQFLAEWAELPSERKQYYESLHSQKVAAKAETLNTKVKELTTAKYLRDLATAARKRVGEVCGRRFTLKQMSWEEEEVLPWCDREAEKLSHSEVARLRQHTVPNISAVIPAVNMNIPESVKIRTIPSWIHEEMRHCKAPLGTTLYRIRTEDDFGGVTYEHFLGGHRLDSPLQYGMWLLKAHSVEETFNKVKPALFQAVTRFSDGLFTLNKVIRESDSRLAVAKVFVETTSAGFCDECVGVFAAEPWRPLDVHTDSPAERNGIAKIRRYKDKIIDNMDENEVKILLANSCLRASGEKFSKLVITNRDGEESQQQKSVDAAKQRVAEKMLAIMEEEVEIDDQGAEIVDMSPKKPTNAINASSSSGSNDVSRRTSVNPLVNDRAAKLASLENYERGRAERVALNVASNQNDFMVAVPEEDAGQWAWQHIGCHDPDVKIKPISDRGKELLRDTKWSEAKWRKSTYTNAIAQEFASLWMKRASEFCEIVAKYGESAMEHQDEVSPPEPSEIMKRAVAADTRTRNRMKQIEEMKLDILWKSRRQERLENPAPKKATAKRGAKMAS